MFETFLMGLAAYAGYAIWPWWLPVLMGAIAGAWNAYRQRPWPSEAGALAYVYVRNCSISALLMLTIYWAVRAVLKWF
jgi:hypothetical protein